MHDASTRRIAVLLALVLGISLVAGGALAAAPSVDTETTQTTQTSDLTGGATQAYNASTTSNFSWSADSPNSTLTVYQDGDEIATFAPENYSAADTDSSGSLDTWYYNVSLADDGTDYPGLEADAGENVTLTFNMTNDTELDSPDHAEVTIYFDNSEDQAIVGADSDDTEVATNNLSVAGYTISEGETEAAQVEEATSITENTTEIRVTMANGSAAEAFGTATDDAETGALTTLAYIEADDGTILPVFVESADVDWLSENATYATVTADGTTLTIHNVNESYDAGNFDLIATGNENVGFWTAYNAVRAAGGDRLAGLSAATDAGVDVNGNPFE